MHDEQARAGKKAEKERLLAEKRRATHGLADEAEAAARAIET